MAKKQTTVISTIGKNIEISLFNGDGVDITQRVREGRTELYNCPIEAEQRAKKLKTYKYQVFDRGGITMGFAVPK